jgi:NAD(P)-dependent dehydrogenase (short-subunit alcohol dehydrogenase family)
VTAACAEAGVVDVLVNNAGFGLEGPIESVPLDDVRRVFETNVVGAARMIQACVPAMRQRGNGVVVNISSAAGVAAGPLGGYYSASKFALEAISEALHLEAGHFGVNVVVIEPGRIATEFDNNVVDHRTEPGPYRELHDLWQQAFGKLGGADAPGPELVAQTVAEALEAVAAGKKQLRWPVGDDAQLISAARQAAPYDDFEAQMREVLQLNW